LTELVGIEGDKRGFHQVTDAAEDLCVDPSGFALPVICDKSPQSLGRGVDTSCLISLARIRTGAGWRMRFATAGHVDNDPLSFISLGPDAATGGPFVPTNGT
jgi:hypothetical protein